jgi:hypothetical protein
MAPVVRLERFGLHRRQRSMLALDDDRPHHSQRCQQRLTCQLIDDSLLGLYRLQELSMVGGTAYEIWVLKNASNLQILR